jgi:hypothetical protein
MVAFVEYSDDAIIDSTLSGMRQRFPMRLPAAAYQAAGS